MCVYFYCVGNYVNLVEQCVPRFNPIFIYCPNGVLYSSLKLHASAMVAVCVCWPVVEFVL